ncbi:MAG: AMP-dependent synthetase [Deltaproteobacteria bacterium]|nr:MAG: AMP-dependent synthetase [Deltaproteobacteria bacterium]
MYAGDWTPRLAELFGDREALYEVRTGRRYSYRELHAAVDDAARLLASLGVTAGDRVAVLAANRTETFLLLFACGRLGALLVPLNWRLKEPELAFLVEDAEPALLFFDAAHAFMAGRLCAGRKTLAVAFDPAPAGDDAFEGSTQVLHWPEQVASLRAKPAPKQAPIDGETPWMVLYTSGTTGHPKGALIPHRQVAYNALNTLIALDLTREDRTVTYTPLFHTGALHVLSTPLFAKGGSVVLLDRFDAEEVVELTASEGCTVLFGVPTTFELMSETPAFTRADLSRIRFALCGGAPCPIALIERYAQRGIVFKQGYGLTEVGPNCLNLPESEALSRAGSAGRPNLHIVARIEDEGQVVEGAGRGELCLAGPCVFLGYWRRPEANEQAFTHDGFFRTGDIVERDAEGWYAIVDRAKDMFISGGENVYPAEVEKVLASHPAVRACAVVGIPDPKWGEVGRAFLELRQACDTESIRSWLKEHLAGYKVPKEFVPVESLPRNPSGKIQKHLLPRSP